MWTLNIPPKVKIFIWRCYNNVVPSLSNLCVRKVVSAGLCQRCKKGAESVAHAMWWCDKAYLVWSKIALCGLRRRFKGLDCYEILKGLAEGLKKEDLEAMCMVMWGVWVDRNEDLHSERCRLAADLVIWVIWVEGLLKEFQEARRALLTAPLVVKGPVVWIPPDVGLLKLNSDVGIKKGGLFCGVGAVIRDDKRWVVAALSKPIHGNLSPEEGELVALREGLILAKQLKLKLSCVELDACNVVSKVSSDFIDVGESEFLVSDIKALFKEVRVHNCQSISKNGNRVAHNLASLALASNEVFEWHDVLP
ncbi:hypothetical protein Dsin_012387 [Dipteronia sinensis]|uniref:Uncharacterized protein n=1 Tax=Dipteronia sinensis TaxID=43782 RepID=A0AAE0AHZ6_9ROSI|nr:hypothetical protein Dsin_012387 [Dipteronia sinensis]